MTLSTILLTELRAQFPHATFAVEVVNATTKQSRLVINGTPLEQTCCDIEDPAPLGTDGKPQYRQSTKIILAATLAAVTSKLTTL